MPRPRRFAQNPAAPNGRKAGRFNMTMRPELKAPALRYCQSINYTLGELLERMLEWRLFQAGYYRPPWTETDTAEGKTTPPHRLTGGEKSEPS